MSAERGYRTIGIPPTVYHYAWPGSGPEVEINIEFKRLSEVARPDIVGLMNNPLVRRQMPLTSENFDEADCERFVAGKERIWEEHGYGPWAFFIDGAFAGWGGLQPEGGDADLALVLHPDYWGTGRVLFLRGDRRPCFQGDGPRLRDRPAAAYEDARQGVDAARVRGGDRELR